MSQAVDELYEELKEIGLTRAERRRRAKLVIKISKYERTAQRLRQPYPVVIYSPWQTRGKTYNRYPGYREHGRYLNQFVRERMRSKSPTADEMALIRASAERAGIKL